MAKDDTSRGRGRPKRRRRVQSLPPAGRFEPVGASRASGQDVELSLDEVEALRLADIEAIYHEEAATAMGVSRSTYGRVLESARHKVALALWGGSALVIDGGAIDIRDDGHSGRGRGLGRGMGRWGGNRDAEGRNLDGGRDHSADSGGEGERGSRRVEGGLGFGTHGACICPKCGRKQEHQPGRPCKRERCPECGVALLREGGEHHRAVVESREKKKG